MVPISFLIRFFAGLVFIAFVKVPDSWLLVFVIVVLILCTTFQSTAVLKLYLSTIPGDVRGVMLGV